MILNRLMYILAGLLVTLVFVGGGVFKTEGFKLEVGSTDVFGVVLLLLTGAYYKLNKKKPDYIETIEKYLLSVDTKKTLSFSIFIFVSIFISHVFKYLSFTTDGMDQTFVHQAIVNGFESPLLKCDFCNYGSYMGEHSSLTLLLITPFMYLFNSPYLIYFLEVMFIALGIGFLFISILKDRKKVWLIAFIIIMSSRSLRQSLVWDFREDHIAFFTLCMAILSAYKGKVILFFISFILTLMSKENYPYALPFLSIALIFEPSLSLSKKQRYLMSFTITLLSVGWLLVNSKFLIPLFNGGAPPTNHMVGRFPGFGATNSEVVINVLTSPTHWWKLLVERVFTKEAFKYSLLVFLPYAPFLIKRWWWLLAASPVFAMNLLSYAGTQRMMVFHYELLMNPILIAGVLFAIKDTVDPKKLILPLVFAVSLSGRWPNFFTWKYLPTVSNIQDRSFFNNLDEEKLYMSSIRVSANLSHFKELRLFNERRRYRSYQDFLSTHSGNHKAPAFNTKGVENLILNLEQENEKQLLSYLRKNGWSVIRKSKSGRLVELGKISE